MNGLLGLGVTVWVLTCLLQLVGGVLFIGYLVVREWRGGGRYRREHGWDYPSRWQRWRSALRFHGARWRRQLVARYGHRWIMWKAKRRGDAWEKAHAAELTVVTSSIDPNDTSYLSDFQRGPRPKDLTASQALAFRQYAASRSDVDGPAVVTKLLGGTSCR